MHVVVDQGRDAFDRRAWASAHAILFTAERMGGLELDDQERLAVAAHLVGEHGDSERAWTAAFQACLARGQTRRAVRCACWLSLALLTRRDLPGGHDWAGRARRLLAADDDCAEQGYVDNASGRLAYLKGDPMAAQTLLDRAAHIGIRHRDPDLTALAHLGRGRSSIRLGAIAAGRGLIEGAVATVRSGHVSPIVVGDVYGDAIDACLEITDAHRAREWTASFSRWCDSQPDLVSHRGVCLMHRAETQQLHGHWRSATTLAEHARQRLSQPPGQPAFGAACYRLAELLRLQGDGDAAEEEYRQASEAGRDPQPGLALLRLAQGHVAAAASAIGRAVKAAGDRVSRIGLLPAFVEIMLAANATGSARAGAEELADHCPAFDTPLVRALSHHAFGAVLLAEGDARAALTALREAHSCWRTLHMPYDTARTRTLIAQAYRRLGDIEAATTEVDAARQAFQHVGAAPDLTAIDARIRRTETRGVEEQ